uniref:Uncharacterized protein n=1 Tax=Cynoglossus semilaevis TaxID=244447 RepID=A0A3P8WJL9_CYNSE
MKEEGLRGCRRFSTCGGTASIRPPHPDGRKLIRNASFGGYNELSPISLHPPDPPTPVTCFTPCSYPVVVYLQTCVHVEKRIHPEVRAGVRGRRSC